MGKAWLTDTTETDGFNSSVKASFKLPRTDVSTGNPSQIQGRYRVLLGNAVVLAFPFTQRFDVRDERDVGRIHENMGLLVALELKDTGPTAQIGERVLGKESAVGGSAHARDSVRFHGMLAEDKSVEKLILRIAFRLEGGVLDSDHAVLCDIPKVSRLATVGAEVEQVPLPSPVL